MGDQEKCFSEVIGVSVETSKETFDIVISLIDKYKEDDDGKCKAFLELEKVLSTMILTDREKYDAFMSLGEASRYFNQTGQLLKF